LNNLYKFTENVNEILTDNVSQINNTTTIYVRFILIISQLKTL
uniref:Zinc finger MYM-type protein 1-like n=1 Tax=Brugia timori TaxID=42155 RepID=A0A0R3RD41_9BILA